MDKAIEQVFKAFNHLAREIQVYLFSGVVIAVNALIIDYFYYNSTLHSDPQLDNSGCNCFISHRAVLYGVFLHDFRMDESG